METLPCSVNLDLFVFFIFERGGYGMKAGRPPCTKHSDPKEKKKTFFEEASFFLSVAWLRVGQTPVTCPIDLKGKKQPAVWAPAGLRGV